ncbi:unnamed protein product [Angiostrongylus costaricensis]|uniref:Transporter n=1 Tax=Angiostrongylus costaricensis TaxID=334426 RepID=A0A158PJB1_ANGCS|nr:unnamed protein product [Angiostrongylus costaricensis]
MVAIRDYTHSSQAEFQHSSGWDASRAGIFTGFQSVKVTNGVLATIQPRPVHKEAKDRGKWGNKCEFVLATLGLAVGLGNIWRFSALAYENGGSAFLFPYIILVILFGLPTLFLEMVIGQYTSSGPSMAFKHYMPALQGIGWSMALISYTLTFYYCLIITWAFLYLLSSFTGGIHVWSSCDNEWNDIYCIVRNKMDECKQQDPSRPVAFNGTCIATVPGPMRTPFDQYFTNVVTKRSQGIEYIGGINSSSLITLALMWLLLFLILIKGYKYMGKAAYFTATAPYIIIVILFLRAVTLEGSTNGLYYYWGKPDFSKLLNHQTWSAALIQICFSLNVGYGGVLMLASYSRKSNNCFKDAWIVVIGDFLMSVFGGATVFATLGYLSHQLKKPIEEVVSSGHSLAFVAYPEAISTMPYPSVWSVCFFMMLFLLGISSQVALTETFGTSVSDQWPSTRRYKWLISLVCCAVSFICGILFTTESGFFWFTIFDSFSGSTGACVVIVGELLIIMYFYGYQNFRDDLIEMLNLPVGTDSSFFGPLSPLWKYAWKITAPISGLAFGWFLSLSPIIPVVLCFVMNCMQFTVEGKSFHELFTIQPTLPSYQRITGKSPAVGGVSKSKSQTSSQSKSDQSQQTM